MFSTTDVLSWYKTASVHWIFYQFCGYGWPDVLAQDNSKHRAEYAPIPDSKVHGSNMERIWARQDPGGPHVGPMNFAIWDVFQQLMGRRGRKMMLWYIY